MNIGGGKLISLSLDSDETLLIQSSHDVDEVSEYSKTLNPLRLFLAGSQFILGRLFLTDQRLILLPYSEEEVRKADLLGKVAYQFLEKIGLGIPQPKIQFSETPLIIPLSQIQSLNPFRKQFKIHPCLFVMTAQKNYQFKFVPSESPQKWAELIADEVSVEISDTTP